MKKLLIMALVLGVVAAFAMPAVALQPPSTTTLQVPGQADVVFDHAAHAALASNCKQCHHYGVGNGSCTDCHGNAKLTQAPSIAAAYTACKTCHTSTPDPVPAPAPAPAPVASCSDYGIDKDACRADADCRWKWRQATCIDR